MKRKTNHGSTQIILFLSILHFMASLFWSRSFFKSIRQNCGVENVAYKWLSTGRTLAEDQIARTMCRIYSFILAFILIIIMWTFVIGVFDAWKNRKIERRYIIIYLLLIVLGVGLIIGIYPRTIVEATDTTWNYTYAKEWLPIYWHGYLTNVIHCACMIIFPHPIAMSIIPYFWGITEMYYFTYMVFVRIKSKTEVKNELYNIWIWIVFLLLAPESLLILTYAGRNYMYALVSVGYIGCLLKDYLLNHNLTWPKFILLAALVVILGTWRSEGVIYLVFFPILLYMVYWYKKKSFHEVKRLVLMKGIMLLAGLYFIMVMPGKYGVEKYQGDDYAIVNTPAPLAAVYHDKNADVSYVGAVNDWKTIFSVIPEEYISKYGKLSEFYYEFDQLNSPRQAHAGVAGKKYIVAAYRILLHNTDIYLKNQLYFYTESIGLGNILHYQEPKIEDWTKNASAEALAWFDWIWSYFSIGKENLSVNYNITIINKKIDTMINSVLNKVIDKVYSIGWAMSGYVKGITVLAMVVICIWCLLKKEWVWVLIGGMILAVLAVIILTAPAMHENYYYSPYYNQYWYILFYLCYMKKRRGLDKAC